MRKVIGILLLCFWIPTVIALAFPESSEGWYSIAGIMMFVFGTWGGVLLVTDKK